MIVAAADGSSLANPGPAGWAWFIDEARWRAGGWEHGTNNMGELMAVLDLLEQTAQAREDLLVYCDSQYVINAVTKWLPGWKRKGWKKADGNPVLNVELMKGIDVALRGRNVAFEWVKGHSGHDLNEAADARARAAAEAFRRGAPVSEGPGFSPQVRTPGTRPAAPSPAPQPDLLSLDELTSVEKPTDEHPAIPLQRDLWRDEFRSNREALAALLHPGFTHHDGRGKARNKARALAAWEQRSSVVDLTIIGIDELAPWAVLLRWRLQLSDQTVLGSSVWMRHGDSWRLRFLQETPASR
ncbi:MAG: RNase H family protein [Propioniciclava sp.]